MKKVRESGIIVLTLTKEDDILDLSKHTFSEGLKDGIPIGLGYLSVSFSFGILAVNSGIPLLPALLISMTNLTSAGQVAGVSIIAASGAMMEMALTQLIINLRYTLMSLSLSQKLDGSFTLLHRLAGAFGITDEIFAVASSKSGSIGKNYLYGLITIPYIGWALGTLLGAAAGGLLPEALRNCLGIAIYGMFLAIIIPPAKKEKGVLIAVAAACIFSCLIRYLPFLSFITEGFSVIICAISAASLAAVLHPVKKEENA